MEVAPVPLGAGAACRLPPPPPYHSQLTSIGVTGTNGKSTTTTYVAAALGRVSPAVPRVTTLGFFVGDEQLDLQGSYAAFLHTLRAGAERGARFAAIELSSEALGRGFIHAWPCYVGVFTNLSRDHLDVHGTMEHYLASKAQLFMHLPPGGTAVLNGCDPASELLAEVLPAGVRVLRYGVPSRGKASRSLDVAAARVEIGWQGTRVWLEEDGALGVPSPITLRAIGDVFAENALAAIVAASAVGVPVEDATRAIEQASPPPGRFEVLVRRPHVVLDYAHTPDALKRTLVAARALCAGQLTVVFGAGGGRDRDKRPLMGQAARGADRVVITNDNPRSEDPMQIALAIQAGLAGHPEVRIVLDRAEAIRGAVADAGPEDVVVVAGKGHETMQHERNLTRIFSDRDVILGMCR